MAVDVKSVRYLVLDEAEPWHISGRGSEAEGGAVRTVLLRTGCWTWASSPRSGRLSADFRRTGGSAATGSFPPGLH